jgi:hypothetical protein
MSRIDDLVANYARFAKLPWPINLPYAQRIWMAVYEPEDERRLRLKVQAFANATEAAGHTWGLIDVTTRFEQWLAEHEYRDEYFESPELIGPAMGDFLDAVTTHVREELATMSTPNSVIGLLGVGSLFGLGDHVKASTLIEAVENLIAGRLLVFFPGSVEDNNYRLLNGRDGWNYHATVLTADKGFL